jgi:hypothetical protein
MIISASYRTDIPTFYGRWFMNRLRAGYCKVINPYNQQAYQVDLRRQEVDGIVFWTKNLSPFFDHLSEVEELGYPFVVQHTINGYPRTLEFSVVDSTKPVEQMARLAKTFGPKVGVWRYDPIVFTSVTPIDFHRKNFRRLAAMLEGTTDEVVVSFAQVYRKTKRNMEWASKEFDFTWEDPSDEIKRDLAQELEEVARSRGMQLAICSQKSFLGPGIKDAQCVDAKRFEQITGTALATKVKGNRPECGCFESRDIGDYDTCPHGCVYCYAVQDRELAQSRFKKHDPDGEFLFPPPEPNRGADKKKQLPLF